MIKISKKRLRQIIKETIEKSQWNPLSSEMPDSVSWGDSGNPYGNFPKDLSEFQESVNDFLDSAGYEPGVDFWWDSEDIESETVVLKSGISEENIDRIQMYLSMALDRNGPLGRFGRSSGLGPGGRRAAFMGNKIYFGQD
jgi:hypothetical protein